MRLPVTKTPKCYIGGAFIRSESGRTFPLHDAAGRFVGHVPQCTRKDLRNAVEAAAAAQPGWARRTPYNRGQILYRLAEMLEARRDELAGSIALAGAKPAAAAREVAATVETLVHLAGWCDKFEQVLGNVNPVAAPYFNFTICEPMGLVGALAPETPSLLGLVATFAPALAAGNAVVALASATAPYPSIVLGELLATSDLPGGVVNLLTGLRAELVPTFASHAHLRALTGVVTADELRTLETGAAESVKRTALHRAETPPDWFDIPAAAGLYALREFLEFKTVWHPIGA
jgi:acyl-CoA reductase-like NAD-dependent aldehyde dehydrogenase